MKERSTEKNRSQSYLASSERIMFPPKPDRQTGFCNYRVTPLLKTDEGRKNTMR